jgi:hypothetical protein
MKQPIGRRRVIEYFSHIFAGVPVIHHRQPARPTAMPRSIMKYRDAEGRVLFVAVTRWGSGKYRTFFETDSKGAKGYGKPVCLPGLPPRTTLEAAQNDLDAYAREHELEAV